MTDRHPRPDRHAHPGHRPDPSADRPGSLFTDRTASPAPPSGERDGLRPPATGAAPATDGPARRRRLALPVTIGAVFVAAALAAGAVTVAALGDTAGSDDLDTLFLSAAEEPGAEPAADPAGSAGPAADDRRRDRGWRRLADGEHVVAGSVASRADTSVVIAKDGGGEVTVPTDGDTTVRGGRNRALTDLDAGERVLIRVGTDGVADRVVVARAHAAGTVTAVDGDRATVTRPGGLTVTLDLSGVDARPAVGTMVVAIGTPAADGSTIMVEALREAPTLG